MPRSRSGASLQYVDAIVTATFRGAPYNPTADQVQFAFTVPGAPLTGSTTWYTGLWDGTSVLPGTVSDYTALCLVGPGGTTTLTAGQYQVSVKVTDNPEILVLSAYILKIT